MLSFGKSSKKKTLRYKVVVKGVTISKHSTKRLADVKAKGIRTAKVLPLRGRTTSRKYKRRY